MPPGPWEDDEDDEELRDMPLSYEGHAAELDAMELLIEDPTERRFLGMTKDAKDD